MRVLGRWKTVVDLGVVLALVGGVGVVSVLAHAAHSPGSPGCGLASAVFCETFDAPAGNGGKTGDLDPVLWGVSRVGDINPSALLNNMEDTHVVGCGTSAQVGPPADVRICNGQMFESLNDNHSVVSLDTYPKQPFDFAGRTGTVTFDVSADSDGSHGAWPEFVITDKPVPGVRSMISSLVPPGAVNSVGFALDGCTNGPGGSTGVGAVFETKANGYFEPGFSAVGCVLKSTPGGPLNHFEVRVSQSRLEVWGTDPGSSTLKQLAVADNLNLGLSRGLVWLNDVHYNARKAVEPCECGTQFEHTFVWDNLGFDGPSTYRDLGFDVPDANVRAGSSTRLGHLVGLGPITLSVSGVNRQQTPTGAQVVLNSYSFGAVVPSIRLNGGPWIDTAWPYPEQQTSSWRSLSIPVPLDQVRDGSNTIEFRSGHESTTVANVSLILVAAAPVPGAQTATTSTTSTSTTSTSTTVPASSSTTSPSSSSSTVPGQTSTTVPAGGAPTTTSETTSTIPEGSPIVSSTLPVPTASSTTTMVGLPQPPAAPTTPPLATTTSPTPTSPTPTSPTPSSPTPTSSTTTTSATSTSTTPPPTIAASPPTPAQAPIIVLPSTPVSTPAAAPAVVDQSSAAAEPTTTVRAASTPDVPAPAATPEAIAQPANANSGLKAVAVPSAVRVAVNAQLASQRIKFAGRSAALTASDKKSLRFIASVLKSNPTLTIAVAAFSDNRGTAAERMQLTGDRSRAIADYLVVQGIAAKRLRWGGFGSGRPLASNATPAGRDQNMRVEITVR